MQNFSVKSIGKACVNEEGMFIKLDPEYIPALKSLDGFGHLNVIWWFSEFDNAAARSVLESPKPYKKGPETMGIFATRSPVRPNPLALTAVEVLDINYQTGVIRVAYIDAHDNTPILDIKPYTPSVDRVENPRVPEWCAEWPANVEQSGNFDWEDVFNF